MAPVHRLDLRRYSGTCDPTSENLNIEVLGSWLVISGDGTAALTCNVARAACHPIYENLK